MRPFISSTHLHAALMTDVLMQQADANTGGGINSVAPRPDIGLDWPEGGAELPEQMLGDFSTLMPDAYVFTLPLNIAQLWHEIQVEDNRPGSKTFGQKITRDQLKFDKANPLVVAYGPEAGSTMTATFTTHPRPRGKKDDPKTPWVSDIAYLMAVSLADKRRPSSIAETKAIINSYAGKEIRLQTGLGGQCRPDAVRKIYVHDPTDLTFAAEGREQRVLTIEDPQGTKGCGARYYSGKPTTKHPTTFKNPNPTGKDDQYFTELQCTGQVKQPDGTTVACGASVRGWPQVEGFLPPLAGK